MAKKATQFELELLEDAVNELNHECERAFERAFKVDNELRRNIQALRSDVRKLMDHLGLTMETIRPDRVIVKKAKKQ